MKDDPTNDLRWWFDSRNQPPAPIAGRGGSAQVPHNIKPLPKDTCTRCLRVIRRNWKVYRVGVMVLCPRCNRIDRKE